MVKIIGFFFCLFVSIETLAQNEQNNFSGGNVQNNYNLTITEKPVKRCVINFRWTLRNTTTDFICIAELNIKKDNSVFGEFRWTLINDGSVNNRYKSAQATENIKGHYDPEKKEFAVYGISINDPNKIYATDVYRITLKNDRDLLGASKGLDGRWEGFLYGTYQMLTL